MTDGSTVSKPTQREMAAFALHTYRMAMASNNRLGEGEGDDTPLDVPLVFLQIQGLIAEMVGQCVALGWLDPAVLQQMKDHYCTPIVGRSTEPARIEDPLIR
jgi:hypothetical protein